jgi:hypothetical protein
MTTWNPLDHHRGPFRLMVMRPKKVAAGSKKYPATFELLKGNVPKADIEEEAQALLNDPRDVIESIYVWSEREEQFVTIIKRKNKK